MATTKEALRLFEQGTPMVIKMRRKGYNEPLLFQPIRVAEIGLDWVAWNPKTKGEDLIFWRDSMWVYLSGDAPQEYNRNVAGTFHPDGFNGIPPDGYMIYGYEEPSPFLELVTPIEYLLSWLSDREEPHPPDAGLAEASI